MLTNVAAVDQFLNCGWPDDFQMQQGRLADQGPLPRSCSCGFQHQPLTGIPETSFNSGDVPLLTRLFWQHIFRALSPVSGHVALRDRSVVFSTSPSTGSSLLLSCSSSSVGSFPESLGSLYRACGDGRHRQLCGLGYVPPRRLMFCMADLAFVSVFIISTARDPASAGVRSLPTRSRSPSRLETPLVFSGPRGSKDGNGVWLRQLPCVEVPDTSVRNSVLRGPL